MRVSVCGSVWHSPFHSFPSSAGVGRTGTFITIDHVLEQIEKEGVVDIPGVIQKIREQRMKMVQTVVCYFLGLNVCVQAWLRYVPWVLITYAGYMCILPVQLYSVLVGSVHLHP